ncbi:MAG: sensor histidine kinase [Myxococcales bacterium]
MIRTISRKQAYAAVGQLVGLVAAAGALAAGDLASRRRPTRRSLVRRVEAHPVAYLAVTTLVPTALAYLGHCLGYRREQRRERSLAAGRMEQDYAGMVAHDFRDPLAALRAQVGALRRRARGDEVSVRVSDLERLERLERRLDRLVGDVVDAMLVESGHVPLRRRAVELTSAIPNLLRRLGPTLASHPVSLMVEGQPPAVFADPARTDQVLVNLLENAAKFSSAGSPIEVLVAPARGGARVSVRDHGVGIVPEELERLFDREYQARRARENKTGLGLGLYLTKGFVEAHGGSIEVESTPGRGSTFHVFLPAPARKEPAMLPT